MISSSLVNLGTDVRSQVLETSIDNQSVELTVVNVWGGVLAPADYKARLSTSVNAPRGHGNSYDIFRAYDLLLPDGIIRTVTVTGLSLPSTNP